MKTILRPYAPPRAEQREPADLLTSQQVANRLAISTRTLWRMVKSGALPAPIRWNKKLVRWKAHDIAAHLKNLST